MVAGNLKLSIVNAVPNNYPRAWAYRNTKQKGSPYKPKRPKFIVWDGEGANVEGWHEYTYLCGYDGIHYYERENVKGLDTEAALQTILQVEKRYPQYTHCIYGGSYDFNMILRDMSFIRLMRLWKEGVVCWRKYRIEMVPRKSLAITDLNTGTRAVLWDVIGFFQTSFMTTLGIVLEDDGSVTISGKGWPVELSQEEAEIIAAGKRQRGSFTATQIGYVTVYCKTELQVFLRLMKVLEDAVHSAGIHLTRWDGAGAVAGAYMKAHKIKRFMRPLDDYTGDWYYRVRCAYSAGHIELSQPGDHIAGVNCEQIFHADLNSAYPSAVIVLPDLANATFTKCNDAKCKRRLGDYDLCNIDFHGPFHARMFPFFHRSYDGSICYPQSVTGWYWGVEINAVIASGWGQWLKLGEHYHYNNDSEEIPFDWIGEEYAKREAYKRDKDPREKILKLGLNSIYGRTAQQAGWKPGRKIPGFHQLEWASLITAITRSKIWLAIADNLDDIVAIETDGIYATKALKLDSGSGLGKWDTERLDRLTYIQSGVYFLERASEIIPRYRGIDAGSLTRHKVLSAWEKMNHGGPTFLQLPSTRFRTLGGSLASEERFKLWRQWVTDKRDLSLTPIGKRIHAYDCDSKWGEGFTHRTIAMQPDKESKPFAVSWVSAEEAERHNALVAELAQEKEDADEELGIM